MKIKQIFTKIGYLISMFVAEFWEQTDRHP